MCISPCEPARHDNGASDVWALTAYSYLKGSMTHLQNIVGVLKSKKVIVT